MSNLKKEIKNFFAHRCLMKTLIIFPFILLSIALIFILGGKLINKFRASESEAVDELELEIDKWESSSESVPQLSPWIQSRLPKDIYPMHYDLLMKSNLTEDFISGEVNITISVITETKFIIVHAKELNISKIAVFPVNYDSQTFSISRQFSYSANDYYVIEMEVKLTPGIYVLGFEFSGFSVYGREFYRMSYENETRYLATTFFTPNFARTTFPCFDEPSFKATFSVHILHNSSFFALSNSLVESITNLGNSLILTKFEKTFPMSVYLLRFMVCDFEYQQTITGNGVRIRGYTTFYNMEKMELALNWTSQIFTFLENYLGVPLPMKKLDIIALPDFQVAGMANWGLITYKDINIFLDDSSTMSCKMKTALLVAREMSHMWFGDLVTMDWWDDTWLNGGFSTHFAWKGAKHVLPEYFTIEDSGINELIMAMQEDVSIGTHPVVETVLGVNFRSVFGNKIMFKKGSSLLRMLENYMGEEDFRKGIKNYLEKYAYGTVKTEYLWNELTAASRKEINITALMNPWVKQIHYPYLAVKRSENNSYCLIQQHTLDLHIGNKTQQKENSSSIKNSWVIPVSYRTSENNNSEFNILDTTNEVNISSNGSDWIKLNSGFSGYYSVNYDLEDWNMFARLLGFNYSIFSPADRISFLVDSFSLASSDILNYSIPLEISRYLKFEEYHQAWSYGLKQLTIIKKYYLDDQHVMNLITEYIKHLSKDLYEKYGWGDSGDFLETKLRVQLIEAACSNHNLECLKTAAGLFKSWVKGEKLNTETEIYVYKYGLQELNDEESFNYMWRRYLEEKNPLIKSRYMHSLSGVRKSELLKRLLEYSTNKAYFRTSGQIFMLKSIANNDKGFPIISNYIFNNWTDIVRNFGPYKAEGIAQNVFSQYQTESDLRRVKEFYRKYPQTRESSRKRSQTMENIRLHIEWRKKYKAQVAEWFQNNDANIYKKHPMTGEILKLRSRTNESTYFRIEWYGNNRVKITDWYKIDVKYYNSTS